MWTGVLWVAGAIAWRERGSFPAFQAVVTWAAALAAFAWVESQEWFVTSRFGVIDPRALQAYGIAIGLLSVGWLSAHRALHPLESVRKLWAEVRPSVDQVVLGGIILGQLLLAAGGILPAIVQELTPVGSEPTFVPAAEAVHIWGAGAWLLVGILAIALVMAIRWPLDKTGRADGPVIGLTILALTVALLVAGRFATELATASALRWGLAVVFLLGSAVVALRDPIRHAAARAGFHSMLSPWTPSWLRGLLSAAAGFVLILTIVVASLVVGGSVPTGPAADSVFRQMGWTVSVIIPCGFLVVGLAGTAWLERSAVYASAAGWVWIATLAGGYAVGAIATSGRLDAVECMRMALIAVGAAAGWALLWLAAERRVPANGLLTLHSLIGLTGLAAVAAIPLSLLLAFPSRPLGPASARLGLEGWLALLAAVAASYWHMHRFAPRWRLHVVGLAAVLAGILAACAVQRWDEPGRWVSFHILAATWAVAAIGMTTSLVSRRDGDAPLACRLWPQVLAVGLVVLGLRGGWADPLRPLAPAGAVLVAGLVFGAVAFRLRSRPHEYVSGVLVALAAVFLWVTWGPDSLSSLALTAAIGLAAAGTAWTAIALASRWPSVSADAHLNVQPGDDELGLPPAHSETLPPFPHFAAAASLGFVVFGLIPTWSGAAVDPPALAWGALAAAVVGFVALMWDRRVTYAAAGLYVLGLAAVALAIAAVRPGPVWLDRITPVALGIYVLAASAITFALARSPEWLIRGPRLPDRAREGHTRVVLRRAGVRRQWSVGHGRAPRRSRAGPRPAALWTGRGDTAAPRCGSADSTRLSDSDLLPPSGDPRVGNRCPWHPRVGPSRSRWTRPMAAPARRALCGPRRGGRGLRGVAAALAQRTWMGMVGP